MSLRRFQFEYHGLSARRAPAISLLASTPPPSSRGSEGASRRARSAPTSAGSITEQRRFSTRYLKYTFKETRPPQWWATKAASDLDYNSRSETVPEVRPYIPPTRKVLPTHPAVHPKASWTETDSRVNPMYRGWVDLHRDLAQLKGQGTEFNTSDPHYITTRAPFEANNDLRFRGADTPMISNLFYEPDWNHRLLPLDAHQVTGKTTTGVAVADAATLKQVTDERNRDEVKECCVRLEYLINLHKDAVGDYEEGRPRAVHHVHEFFVAFQQGMMSFDFQDGYLANYLRETQPESLKDLWAIFLQMEANYVNTDYCPRCSMPMTSAYCGEGDGRENRFRKYRGRPVPHKAWGKEWYDVVANRAEALWYRAQEDPLFGNDPEVGYSQAQVEGLLRVYCKTLQRGRANTFMHRLRGSSEYLQGRIKVTPGMQLMYDELLDTTAHPHLLTNGFKVEQKVAKYLGEEVRSATNADGSAANGVPLSPKQFRIDMEVNKMRRQQREEGVVKVPPEGWKIETQSIVGYQTDPNTGQVTNWRQVKKSIEQSFMATGLPESAFTAEERREMLYLTERQRAQPAGQRVLKSRLAEEKQKLRAASKSFVVYPDGNYYRTFDISDTALEKFKSDNSPMPANALVHGTKIRCRRQQFVDPANIQAEVGGKAYTIDVTPGACAMYTPHRLLSETGLVFRPGMRLSVTLDFDNGEIDVVLIGVDKSGPPEQWQLLAYQVGHDTIVHKLGKNCKDVLVRCEEHEALRIASEFDSASPSWLSSLMKVKESSEGHVIGVRDGVLYVAFTDSVATPFATRKHCPYNTIQVVQSVPATTKLIRNATIGESAIVIEPPSWAVPFRNDWTDAKLESLKKAPWDRQEWTSMIPNKYTPKVKRFGYTQHTTQDDLVTGEYNDRLRSKQIFSDPKKFKVIPDRHDQSVFFGGKNESLRAHGVPTVDREELDRGWADHNAQSDDVPAAEADAVEQALRDISGRRPGNFSKRKSEIANFSLEESWWSRMQPGWQERQEEDRFNHPAERRAMDVKKLPFGGRMPAYGETHGIADRIRDIQNDWSKGFDVGPNGYQPGANNRHSDSLGFQSMRAKNLPHSDPVLLMFMRKLAANRLDVHSFVSSADCAGHDPKMLLLALHEWMQCGRPPSLSLALILKKYLEAEIDEFNAHIPSEGIPKLHIDVHTGVVTHANSTASSVWVDQETSAYKEYIRTAMGDAIMTSSGGGDDQSAVVRAYMAAFLPEGFVRECEQGGANGDILLQHLKGYATEQLIFDLAGVVSKDIDPAVLRNATATIDKKTGGAGAQSKAAQLVHISALRDILSKVGVRRESVAALTSGLFDEVKGGNANARPDDFNVPVATILSWRGTTMGTGSAYAGAPEGRHSGRDTSTSKATGHGQEDKAKKDMPAFMALAPGFVAEPSTAPAILAQLARNSDGFALDALYRSRENKRRVPVFDDFLMLACVVPSKSAVDGATKAPSPIVPLDHCEAVYADYCDYGWAPKPATAADMVANFCAAAEESLAQFGKAEQQAQIQAELRKNAESFKTSGNAPALLAERVSLLRKAIPSMLKLDGKGQVVDIIMRDADPAVRPFEFENVAFEKANTLAKIRDWRLPIGEESEPAIPLAHESAKRDVICQNVVKGDQQAGDNSGRSLSFGVDYISTRSGAGIDKKIKVALSGTNSAFVNINSDFDECVYFANRVLYRCFPLLLRAHEIVKFQQANRFTEQIAHRNRNQLSSIIQKDKDSMQETEFRNNAEKYWRKVLEGRGFDDIRTEDSRQTGPAARKYIDVPTSVGGQGSFAGSLGKAMSQQPSTGSYPATTGLHKPRPQGPGQNVTRPPGGATSSAGSGSGGGRSPMMNTKRDAPKGAAPSNLGSYTGGGGRGGGRGR